MRIPPHVDLLAVVLTGNFNPAIFQPAWFAAHGLIGQSDADNADIKIIHPEVSHFRAGEFTILVELQRFTAQCDAVHIDLVRDLVLGTFGTNLPHTPVTAMGINREVHFDTGDFWVRDAVGKKLAPHTPWGDWGNEISGPREITSEHGGMLRITMRSGYRKDGFKNYTLVDVQPSLFSLLESTGIFVLVNRHFILSDGQKTIPVGDVLRFFDDHWRISVDKAESIIDQLQKLTEETREEMK